MRCKGTMYDGPQKLFARCNTCHRVSYQAHGGDPCTYVLPIEGVRDFSWTIVERLAEINPVVKAVVLSYPGVSREKQLIAVVEELAEENAQLIKELVDEKKDPPSTTLVMGGSSSGSLPMMYDKVFDELLDEVKDIDDSVSVGVLSTADENLVVRAENIAHVVSLGRNIDERKGKNMKKSNEEIAMIAHNVNRAYCLALGDDSQVDWDDTPDWQKKSILNGVKMLEDNPDVKPSASHESWLKEKTDDGWVYGEVKDVDKKTHPCCVPYDKLPVEQKAKDFIFGAVVRQLLKM